MVIMFSILFLGGLALIAAVVIGGGLYAASQSR
jgi:hypothetical protein